MKKVIVSFVTGALVGGLAIGAYFQRTMEHELTSMWFEEELYRAQVASRYLKLIDEGRIDAVRRGALTELKSAIDTSYNLMVSAKPDVTAVGRPNILRGIDEAEDCLVAHDSKHYLVGWLRDVKSYVGGAAKN